MTTLVLDACVLAKIFVKEKDTEQVIELLRYCMDKEITIMCPDILRYELMQIAIKKDLPINALWPFIEQHLYSIVELVTPDLQTWIQAEKIATHGHPKSGFPTLYDSVYHATAIMNNATFITADKKHFAKVQAFWQVILLKDWKENI